MTWTYGGDPSVNARDAIRFLTGDTDTNDQLVNDEEIAWMNNQVTGSDTATTSLYEAAARVLLAMASKFTREADKQVGDLRISFSQKAASAREQASELRMLAAREGSVPTPYAGGISISDKDIDRGDSDIVEPYFQTGQFGNNRGGGTEILSANSGADL
jgi:hypothetical protein